MSPRRHSASLDSNLSWKLYAIEPIEVEDVTHQAGSIFSIIDVHMVFPRTLDKTHFAVARVLP
jgi:hypothetical protein